jgi:hypothetical protein
MKRLIIVAMIAGTLPVYAQAAEGTGDALGQTPSQAAHAACEPGIFILRQAGGEPQAERMAFTQTVHRKVSNMLGFALTGGISGMKVKTVLAGAAAKFRTADAQPSFRFCFAPPAASAEATSGSGPAYVGAQRPTNRPQDYALVRFESTGKNRELAVAKAGLGSFSGALSDSTVQVEVVEEAAGVFRVRPLRPLPSGEYGFIRSVGGGAPKTSASSKEREDVLDFGIEGNAASN